MDVFEGCLFLLVAEDFLQVSYRHAIIHIVRAEGVPEGMYTGFSHPGLFVILSDKFADTALHMGVVTAPVCNVAQG